MAEFCAQCSKELFGQDYGDLKGIVAIEGGHLGTDLATVVCEGCGIVQVDNSGRCVSVDCDKQHGLHTQADELADEAEAQSEKEKGQ